MLKATLLNRCLGRDQNNSLFKVTNVHTIAIQFLFKDLSAMCMAFYRRTLSGQQMAVPLYNRMQFFSVGLIATHNFYYITLSSLQQILGEAQQIGWKQNTGGFTFQDIFQLKKIPLIQIMVYV